MTTSSKYSTAAKKREAKKRLEKAKAEKLAAEAEKQEEIEQIKKQQQAKKPATKKEAPKPPAEEKDIIKQTKTIKAREKKPTEEKKVKPPYKYQHVCVLCGTEFESRNKDAKLCSPECVAKHNQDFGRPPIDLEHVKELLKPFLQIGCSLKEAALESQCCSYETVLKYKDTNKHFFQWIEAMQNFSIIKAKRVMYKALQKDDKDAAKWWLSKKKPAEFGNKVDVTSKGGAIWFTMDLWPSQFGTYEDEDEAPDTEGGITLE